MIIDLGILTIKVDVLIVQIINIALLLWFFKSLIGNSLALEVEKRRLMTKKLEQADQEYESLIAKANAEKDLILDDALSHKKSVLIEAAELANKQKQQILDKAESEAKKILDKAESESLSKSRDLETHFASGVKQAALSVVKKIFASKKDTQEAYLSWLVDEFTTSYQK